MNKHQYKNEPNNSQEPMLTVVDKTQTAKDHNTGAQQAQPEADRDNSQKMQHQPQAPLTPQWDAPMTMHKNSRDSVD